MKLIDHGDAVVRMNGTGGAVYSRGEIPPNAYPGHTTTVSTVDIYDLLVVGEAFDAELAYQIVKLMFERRADLIAVHRNMEAMSAAAQGALATAPLHPGAQRYLREIGVLKA
jgi:hypothetical protein